MTSYEAIYCKLTKEEYDDIRELASGMSSHTDFDAGNETEYKLKIFKILENGMRRVFK